MNNLACVVQCKILANGSRIPHFANCNSNAIFGVRKKFLQRLVISETFINISIKQKAFARNQHLEIRGPGFSNLKWSRAVVGNHRAAARCRSVRSSLPGRIIFQIKCFETFFNVRSNYFRTFY